MKDLEIPPYLGAETTYRRALLKMVRMQIDRLTNNRSASLTDLEVAAIAGFEVTLLSIEKYNARAIRRGFREYFKGADAAAKIEAALDANIDVVRGVSRAANVDLIKDITETQRSKMFEALADNSPGLEDRIQGILKSSKYRARVIARDQTAKINSAISAERHKGAGATQYEWVTAGDERVRPAHLALNGRIYAYGAPTGAEGGEPPGQPILCRCIASPIF